MKEILKSKAIVGLFILMLGFVYLKSEPINSIEMESNENKEIVYINK